MRVLILGGDGYLGWPTAMHLSAKGNEVVVVDSFLKRNVCAQLGLRSLTRVPALIDRIKIWNSENRFQIGFREIDLLNYEGLSSVFREFQPEVCIHYAEQPSGPFSMMSHHGAELTLSNNVLGTLNVLHCLNSFCPNCHLVKLGTMGEYGTPDIDIEEGWLEVTHNNRQQRFLYPRQASSLYHTSKIMDTDLIWFYVRTWGLRVTDLMQGPVYGIFTDENCENPELYPHFYYDEIMGTVINRFVVQAACGYPLTVYGVGGQTRGYLDIRDTLQCVALSADNPPARGELKIYNQIVETFTVNELANLVCIAGDEMGLTVEVKTVQNPRVEREEHYYNVKATSLLDLGLKPHYLEIETLKEMIKFALDNKSQIDQSKILTSIKWRGEKIP